METETPDTKLGLTTLQDNFVRAYCGEAHFVGAKAVRLAGYQTKYPGKIAYQLLENARIKEAISRRLKAFHMSQDEALLRMAAWARGDIRPFIKEGLHGQLEIDLSTKEARRHLSLIRELKQKKKVLTHDGEGEEEVRILEIETEIKLHDAKDATKTVLQAHGTFGAKGTEDDPRRHTLTIEWATDDET